MISANMVAHSRNAVHNKEIASMEVVLPRFVLAEFNTHRMFSRNSASSRAIPFRKMLREVLERPFIPYAWQKDHSGMQGTEYYDKTEQFAFDDIYTVLKDKFKYKEGEEIDANILKILQKVAADFTGVKTLDEWWLTIRDKVVECAVLMFSFGVTKQLVNRLLEPFMYHKVLVTATEWENFFYLRCPQYQMETSYGTQTFRSRYDYLNNVGLPDDPRNYDTWRILDWMNVNKSGAEIHIALAAEAMWDCLKNSTPKILLPGEWHLPYGDQISIDVIKVSGIPYVDGKYQHDPSYPSAFIQTAVKIAVARCARLSYQTLGDDPKIDYAADIKLHDTLLKSGHMSPFEHIARCMTTEEWDTTFSGMVAYNNLCENAPGEDWRELMVSTKPEEQKMFGWSGNFQGFVQYRKLLPNENRS